MASSVYLHLLLLPLLNSATYELMMHRDLRCVHLLPILRKDSPGSKEHSEFGFMGISV